MTVGGLATVPSRIDTLKQVIDSIAPQLDLLYIVLNGHREVPQWLKEVGNVKYIVSDNKYADSAKFMFCEKHPNVYYFGLDDDLIMPNGYVNEMIEGVNRYRGVVSLHGRKYPRPFISFTKWEANYRCLNTVREDVFVDLVGTGVCAFNTSRLRVILDDFPEPNMADIWLSKLAWGQGVPLVVLKHDMGYLKYLPQKTTIWHQQAKTKFEKQTEILKLFLK